MLPGRFTHAVNHLLDHDFDLSSFDARCRNDDTCASAYPPGMLLKIILYAYAEGVVSSRGIERLCREHVTFIALSGDIAPHFTTLAAFVSGLGDGVVRLFAHVLYLCDRQGLIGRQMFAIPQGDFLRGVDRRQTPKQCQQAEERYPSRLQRQAGKLEAAAQALLARHRDNDALPVEPDLAEKETRQKERLTREVVQMRQWLSAHPEERRGAKGKVIKSNRTDNESAEMATSKGVIQGYLYERDKCLRKPETTKTRQIYFFPRKGAGR